MNEHFYLNIFIYFISVMIVFSKFLDCYTTSSQITNLNQERNPNARKLMKRFGVHTTIWVVFGISVIIVMVSLFILFKLYNSLIFKIIYLILGTVISFTQFAVAHTNKTRKLNIFTKILLKKYENKKKLLT